ncbi:MAG: cytochrome P450 [Rhodoferax sp.]|nr:cytochrome P450 [Rhodoferax sp.]
MPAPHPDAAAHAVATPKAIRPIADLPGPPGLPFLGNALQFRSPSLHLELEAWAAQYGPYYQLRAAGRRILVLSDHQVVASVLRDRPAAFSRTARLREIGQEMGLQPGVFSAEGEDWMRQRRMVMAGFDPGHVRAYYPALVKVAQRLVKRWTHAARRQETIVLQSDLMRYTVDTIAGLAFGAEVDTLGSDGDVIQQHLDKVFPALFRRITAPIPLWRIFPSRADRALARSMVEVNKAVDSFIAQARLRMQAEPQRHAHPHNLLEAMLAAADRPDSGLTDAQVAGNVMTMLLAGEDTTANTIAWMIYLLWTHPQALDRACAEVRTKVQDCQRPTMEEVAELEFIEACIHETMRLKPVGPQLPLQANADVLVGDVQVPKGTIVINLLRVDSVREDLVPQAAQFAPERWLEANNPAKRLSTPFGAGPRICPGRYLAMLEMKIAMTVLLGQFDIEFVGTADGQAPQERLSFAMMPVGLQMRLRTRVQMASSNL